MHGMFIPQPHEHLWEWLRDAHSYTEGRRVETNNFTLSKTNRMPELSLEAAFILRHIMFSFSLNLEKTFALWACFYALLMRREIPLDYFRSKKNIWTNVLALQPIDDHLATNRLKEYILSRTPLGFRRCFFLSSDDPSTSKSTDMFLSCQMSSMVVTSQPFDVFRLLFPLPKTLTATLSRTGRT